MVTEHKVTVDTPITGVVQKLEDHVGSYGPSYKITLDTGAGVFTVLDKKERFDKAFKDISLSRDTVVGRTIKVWKRPMAEDPKKGYLNIDLMDTGRAANPIAPPPASSPGATASTGAQPTQLPGWLDKEAKEGQIKERARADFDWAWNVAWGIMAPKIEGVGSSMGDPMVVQATQAAAIGLVIRL